MTTVDGWRRAPAAALLVLALGVVAACGGEPPAAPVTQTVPAPLDARRGVPPTPDVPLVWPLTGIETDEVADRPALAVKIENSVASRPQTGLEDADIVWEQVVEGGITRFVAVYHSRAPELVGPVRSVRPTDPAIVAPQHGVLAYTGGQRPFVDAVAAAGVQSVVMDAGDPGFVRMPERRAPHNIYGDLESFWDQADADRTVPPVAELVHARAGEGSATTEGDPAERIDVRLTFASSAVWHWSADDSAYLRDEGTTPAVSADGERLSAANVVLLDVVLVNTEFRDVGGAAVPRTELVASGVGHVASGGRWIPVSWSKAAVEAPLTLTTADGTAVLLEPGTTWIELVPGGSYTAG
nr:DUF3048 domain-containing protein [Oerskovia sp. JB1-3-2]